MALQDGEVLSFRLSFAAFAKTVCRDKEVVLELAKK